MKNYTVGFLFAGIGGIDLGFEQAGAEVIWANEIDKHACITYRANFDNILIEGNIRNLDPDEMPKVDIITAGWPCVAFSIAGQRHGMNHKCHNCGHKHMVSYEDYISGPTCPKCGGYTEAIDPRGTLFYDIVRFIRAIKPKALLLENVKNLESHDKGNTYRIIRQMLRESGYYVVEKVMNTMEYGNIPQNRERIYIVGFKEEEALINFVWPYKIALTRTIDDFLDRHTKQDDKYYYTKDSQYYKMLQDSLKNKNTVYQIRRVYVRENQSNVCPTLTANMGMGGHNVPIIIDDWGYRKLTPKEVFRFQGFPVDEDFIIPEDMANSHLYKQAGNSVSVPVIKRIADKILYALDSFYKKEEEKNIG